MKKDLDWIDYKYYNDRDLEEPLVTQFVSRAVLQSAWRLNSILDIGGHWSGHTYAPRVREWIGNDCQYDAIDLLVPDEETPKYVDKYIIGNVRQEDLPIYDLVMCISSVEHSGITTYQVEDYQSEQTKVVERCLQLAGKRMILTHPFGEEGLYPGQYANITPEQLDYWIRLAEKGYNLKTSVRFFYNKFCQGKELWYEVDKEFASRVPMDKALGTQCVACTEFSR